MTNVFREACDVLHEFGYHLDDVKWVGSQDGYFAMSIDEFIRHFGKLEYDSGLGAQVLPTDLVMVVDDSHWFSRHEYDGAEEWRLNTAPVKRPDSHHFSKIMSEWRWATLEETQYEEGDNNV